MTPDKIVTPTTAAAVNVVPDLHAVPAPGPMIPGAREPNTLTRHEPGTMGGAANGSDVIGPFNETMGARTTAERRHEGGGPRPSTG
jgi:hypothetical protein